MSETHPDLCDGSMEECSVVTQLVPQLVSSCSWDSSTLSTTKRLTTLPLETKTSGLSCLLLPFPSQVGPLHAFWHLPLPGDLLLRRPTAHQLQS